MTCLIKGSHHCLPGGRFPNAAGGHGLGGISQVQDAGNALTSLSGHLSVCRHTPWGRLCRARLAEGQNTDALEHLHSLPCVLTKGAAGMKSDPGWARHQGMLVMGGKGKKPGLGVLTQL